MERNDENAGQEAASIRRALGDGLNAMALDNVRHATQAHGDREPAEILYLGALASVRMGATDEAQGWLDRMDAERIDDPALAEEVWSLAGRIAKDRYAAARHTAFDAARHHAGIAVACYRRAFEVGGSPYPAVNAATMAMLLGDAALAQTLARQGLAACGKGNGPDHWQHASKGEALLLLGRLDEARTEYALARKLAGASFGDVASMRRQLMLIGSREALELLACLPAPAVIAFSGHMIDDPGRPDQRFPPALENTVAAVLRERIVRLGPAIGFSQAACGSDILFLEAMQDAGMQTHVVLPCATADFIDSSVRFGGESWIARFDRVLARATSKLLATEEPLLGDDVLFEHASNLIHGMALLRATELSTQPLLLAVKDPDAPMHDGGTAATAEGWRRRNRVVETIDLAALRAAGSSPSQPVTGAGAGRARPTTTGRSLKSLLFADIKGFSHLPEKHTREFADLFLGTCKRLLDSLDQKVVDANTRGDGIFLVFDRPGDAAQFAVRLQQDLAQVDWSALALPAETRARVGLHTGPVFRTYDPVMNKPTYYGTHVNRAARLEPIVRPGHIFATEAFASSLVAEDDERFRCHYIGEMPLAKQFGDARLYRLVRAGEE
jgi:class 3 adenylate cyclase